MEIAEGKFSVENSFSPSDDCWIRKIGSDAKSAQRFGSKPSLAVLCLTSRLVLLTLAMTSLWQFLRSLPPSMIAFCVFIGLSGILCLVAIQQGWIDRETLQHTVSNAGGGAIAAFIFGTVLIQFLWMPRLWSLLAAGALFGPLLGAVLSYLADQISAAICYSIARGGGQKWVGEQLHKKPKAQKVVELLAKRRGAATTALLRACPVAHYTATSYAAGLAGVKPRSYLLGTAIGAIPAAILYPLVGDAALKPGSPIFLFLAALTIVGMAITYFAGRRFLRELQ